MRARDRPLRGMNKSDKSISRTFWYLGFLNNTIRSRWDKICHNSSHGFAARRIRRAGGTVTDDSSVLMGTMVAGRKSDGTEPNGRERVVIQGPLPKNDQLNGLGIKRGNGYKRAKRGRRSRIRNTSIQYASTSSFNTRNDCMLATSDSKRSLRPDRWE